MTVFLSFSYIYGQLSYVSYVSFLCCHFLSFFFVLLDLFLNVLIKKQCDFMMCLCCLVLLMSSHVLAVLDRTQEGNTREWNHKVAPHVYQIIQWWRGSFLWVHQHGRRLPEPPRAHSLETEKIETPPVADTAGLYETQRAPARHSAPLRDTARPYELMLKEITCLGRFGHRVLKDSRVGKKWWFNGISWILMVIQW